MLSETELENQINQKQIKTQKNLTNPKLKAVEIEDETILINKHEKMRKKNNQQPILA